MIDRTPIRFSNIYTRLTFEAKFWYDSFDSYYDCRYFSCEELPVRIVIDDERKPKGCSWYEWLDMVLKKELVKKETIQTFPQSEFTYLIKTQFYYKIGKSKNVASRFYGVSSTNPDCELCGFTAGVPEVVLHHIFKFWRHKGEWFNFSEDCLLQCVTWWIMGENMLQKEALLNLYIYCNQGIKYETGRSSTVSINPSSMLH